MQIIPVSLVHFHAQRFALLRAFQNGQKCEKFSEMDKNQFSSDHHVIDHFWKNAYFSEIQDRYRNMIQKSVLIFSLSPDSGLLRNLLQKLNRLKLSLDFQ